jgi:hypothetical protein
VSLIAPIAVVTLRHWASQERGVGNIIADRAGECPVPDSYVLGGTRGHDALVHPKE